MTYLKGKFDILLKILGNVIYICYWVLIELAF